MRNAFLVVLLLFAATGASAQNTLSLSSVSGHPGDTVSLVLSMNMTDSPVAVQAMIPLGDQLDFVPGSCVLNSNRINGHQLAVTVVNDTLRIYSYSLALQPFTGASGALLSFQVALGSDPNTYTLPLCNARMSSASGAALAATATGGAVTILAPKIHLVPNSIDFGHCPIRSTYSRSVTIFNTGNEPLVVDGVTFNDSSLSCSLSNVTVAPGGSTDASVRFSPLVAGAVASAGVVHTNAHVGDSLITVAADPFSVNELSVVYTTGCSDSVVRVFLSMENMDSVVGLQTRVVLPSALTYIPGSFRVESSRAQDHQAVAGLSGDTLSMLVFSPTNRALRGGNGDVCSFEVRLAGYGSYYLYLRNTVLSDAAAHNVLSQANSNYVYINSPVLSAATSLAMGASAVTDTAIVAFSVRNTGNAPLAIHQVLFTQGGYSISEALPLVVPAYGMASLHVSYFDQQEGPFATLMKLYTNDPNQTMYDVQVSGTRYEPNVFALQSDSELEDSVMTINVSMTNYSQISAVQFDIEYPYQFFAISQSDFVKGERADSHIMSVVRQNDSVFRVIVFSMDNSAIQGNTGDLLTMRMHPVGTLPQAAYPVVAHRMILADRLGSNKLSDADSVCIIGGVPLAVSVTSENDTMGSVAVAGRAWQGRSITLTATANHGYHFDRWSDGVVDNPRTVLLTQDTTLVARFKKNLYRVLFGSSDTLRGAVEEVVTHVNNDADVFVGSGSQASYNTPFNNYYRYSTNECLYLASEIASSGVIDTISYVVAYSNAFSYSSLNIYMGTTSATSLNSGWVDFEGLQLVYSRSEGTIGAQSGIEHYPLDTPFDYNGSDNLVVVVCRQSSYYTNSLQYRYSSMNGMCRYRQSDNEPAVGSLQSAYGGSLTDCRANIRLSFIPQNDTLREFLDTLHLVATPNRHYVFSHWSDGSTVNPRWLTITQDTNILAFFNPVQYQITGFCADSLRGYVTGSAQVPYLDSVVLTAFSRYGYHFVSWDDGVSDNPRVVVADTNKSFAALFDYNQYSVTGYASYPDMGSVTGSDTVNYLSSVTLTAVPNYGYHFIQWNDGNSDNPRMVVADSNRCFTALFDYNQYAVTVASADSTKGAVSGGGTGNYLDTMIVAASAFYGYHFTQWSDGNSDNPRVVVADSNKVLVAQFANNLYDVLCLSADSSQGVTTGGGTLAYLSTATVVAVPNHGYMFSHWNDGNSNNPRSIQVVGDTVLTAFFSPAPYAITVSVNNLAMGQVAVSGSYVFATNHVLTAVANYGYHFVQWNDGNTDNPRSFMLMGDTSFVAQFDYNQYAVTGVSADSLMGSVTGSATQDYLSNVTLTAIPNYGYHFTSWNDGDTSNPRIVEVDSNVVYTALFATNSYTVTGVSADSLMGSVIGSATQDYLSTVTLTAIPNYGYHFTSWNDGDTANPRIVEVDSNVVYTALFATNSYTVTGVSADTLMGSVTGSATQDYLSTVTLTAIPNYGYHFTSWNDGDTSNPRTVEVDSNVVYTALFDYNQYTVTVTSNDDGYGTVEGGGEYAYLSEAVLVATASEGYHFVGWSNGDTNATITIVVTEDVALEASFAPNVGVGSPTLPNIKVGVDHTRIIVYGAEGLSVSVYDLSGRLLGYASSAQEVHPFVMPTGGVYVVRCGSVLVRKVCVVK